MKKPYSIPLELYEGVRQDYAKYIRYVVGDAETMPLCIHLTARGRTRIPKPGAIATLNFELPGNIRFPRKAQILGDGTLLYEVAQEDISKPGLVTVSVTIEEGGPRLTWQGFAYTVVDSLACGQTESPDYLNPWVQEMTQSLAELSVRVEDIIAGGGGSGGGEAPFQLSFGTMSWATYSDKYRLTIPASQHRKGVRASVSCITKEASAEQKAIVPNYTRYVNGDIGVISHAPFSGQITIT